MSFQTSMTLFPRRYFNTCKHLENAGNQTTLDLIDFHYMAIFQNIFFCDSEKMMLFWDELSL